MESISHVTKNVKGVPHEITVGEDRKNEQSSSKVANDATIFSSSAFPMSMVDNIFIFMTTIKICPKCLTHKSVVKAVIDYFR